MGEVCPECGCSFERIGIHWSHSDCSYPELSDYQQEVVSGILMGDGYLSTSQSNPYVTVSVIRKDYLDYLDERVFGMLSTGVELMVSAEESAENCRSTGFSQGADAKNYSDVYRMRTRCLPCLDRYRDWYSDGEKSFPEGLNLSPTKLLHWYVCDGHFDVRSGRNRIKISASNEYENRKKINSYFENIDDMSRPSWQVSERSDGTTKADIQFTSDQTEKLFQYMNRSHEKMPLPGFEYKFPEKYS